MHDSFRCNSRRVSLQFGRPQKLVGEDHHDGAVVVTLTSSVHNWMTTGGSEADALCSKFVEGSPSAMRIALFLFLEHCGGRSSCASLCHLLAVIILCSTMEEQWEKDLLVVRLHSLYFSSSVVRCRRNVTDSRSPRSPRRSRRSIDRHDEAIRIDGYAR